MQPISPSWRLNVSEAVPLVECIPLELEHEWLARIGGKASTGFGRDKGEAKRGPLYTCILLLGAGAAAGEWYDSVVDTGDTRVAIGGNWWVLPLLILEWPIGLGWGGSLAGKGRLCAYSVLLTLFFLNMVTDDEYYSFIFWYIVWWWAGGGGGLREFDLEGGEWRLIDVEDDAESWCSAEGRGENNLPRPDPDEIIGHWVGGGTKPSGDQ